MGDFNVDLNKTDCVGFGKLEEFCDNFNLTNLVKLKVIHVLPKIINRK